MKRDTWMPLYIGDYLADTTRLTTEQHGAYLLLLMDYWRNGPPPDDEQTLASITKLSVQQWRRHEAVLRTFFQPGDGACWVQKRADDERQKAGNVSDKRSAAGKEGASKRWGKQHGNRIANAMANASQTASQNDAPSQSEEIHNPPASQAPPGGKPRGERLPDGWDPGEAGMAFAAGEGLANGAAAAELARFRDYWAAQPGAKGRKADWPATWRNWVRKAAESRPRLVAKPADDLAEMFRRGQG